MQVTFYALGGNETLWFQASYHLPLFPDIRKQALFAYIDKVYARLYVDAAAAWNGAWPGFGELRKDVGAEIRMMPRPEPFYEGLLWRFRVIGDPGVKRFLIRDCDSVTPALRVRARIEAAWAAQTAALRPDDDALPGTVRPAGSASGTAPARLPADFRAEDV